MPLAVTNTTFACRETCQQHDPQCKLRLACTEARLAYLNAIQPSGQQTDSTGMLQAMLSTSTGDPSESRLAPPSTPAHPPCWYPGTTLKHTQPIQSIQPSDQQTDGMGMLQAMPSTSTGELCESRLAPPSTPAHPPCWYPGTALKHTQPIQSIQPTDQQTDGMGMLQACQALQRVNRAKAD